MSKTKELNEKLLGVRKLNWLHTIWRHYKGGVYKILGYTISTTDGNVHVRYERIDGPDFDVFEEIGIEYTRPLDEWGDIVFEETHPGFPPAPVPRFVRVRKEEVWVEDE